MIFLMTKNLAMTSDVAITWNEVHQKPLTNIDKFQEWEMSERQREMLLPEH